MSQCVFDVLSLICSLHSKSGGADTLSRIERGAYTFPEAPAVSALAKDFVAKVSFDRNCDRFDLYVVHLYCSDSKILE